MISSIVSDSLGLNLERDNISTNIPCEGVNMWLALLGWAIEITNQLDDSPLQPFSGEKLFLCGPEQNPAVKQALTKDIIVPGLSWASTAHLPIPWLTSFYPCVPFPLIFCFLNPCIVCFASLSQDGHQCILLDLATLKKLIQIRVLVSPFTVFTHIKVILN